VLVQLLLCAPACRLTIIFAILNGFTDLVLAAFAAKYQFVLRAGTFDEVMTSCCDNSES
jgi:hypothetical protein